MGLIGVWVHWAKEVIPGFGLSWEESPCVSTGVGADSKGWGRIQCTEGSVGGDVVELRLRWAGLRPIT